MQPKSLSNYPSPSFRPLIEPSYHRGLPDKYRTMPHHATCSRYVCGSADQLDRACDDCLARQTLKPSSRDYATFSCGHEGYLGNGKCPRCFPRGMFSCGHENGYADEHCQKCGLYRVMCLMGWISELPIKTVTLMTSCFCGKWDNY